MELFGVFVAVSFVMLNGKLLKSRMFNGDGWQSLRVMEEWESNNKIWMISDWECIVLCTIAGAQVGPYTPMWAARVGLQE